MGLRWSLTFEYDVEGGGQPFKVAETHVATTQVETAEEHFSECPLGDPASFNPGWR